MSDFEAEAEAEAEAGRSGQDPRAVLATWANQSDKWVHHLVSRRRGREAPRGRLRHVNLAGQPSFSLVRPA